MTKSLYSARQKMIAKIIIEHRQAKGLTQTQVAKAMGKTRHQPFIASIESGGRRIDIVELLRLADIIDLDVKALIDKLSAIPDE